MASLLRRSKLWNTFVPPPGFESPRTAELKFLIFFAACEDGIKEWWHPTEVATRVGSGNREAAKQLCLKLTACGYLCHQICHISKRGGLDFTFNLDTRRKESMRDKRANDFVVGYRASSLLSVAYRNGELLGMFRIAKSDRRPLATRIFEYLADHPEPIELGRLRAIIRATGSHHAFNACIGRLTSQKRVEFVDQTGRVWSDFTCRLTASEWLKQETKRRKRAVREEAKKEKALRKRRRTLKKKKKAKKKRTRPSLKGALEL
jgi:hypothetical protein